MGAFICAFGGAEDFGTQLPQVARNLHIDDQLDAFQKRTLTDEQRLRAGQAAVIAQVVVNKQLTFTWSFP